MKMQNTVNVSINQNHSSFSEKAFAEKHMKNHFVLMLYVFIKVRVCIFSLLKKGIIILYILLYEYFIIKSFPGGSDGKVSAYNAGDLGSFPGSGRSPGEGNGNPLQYSFLENSMDRGVS